MSVERTLVLIKPDGVQHRHVGEIISRIERKGLRILGLQMRMLTDEMAAKHYAEHIGKDFYAALVDFMKSGPIVAMVVEGDDAIAEWRAMMGPTNPVNAAPGTIRGDFATNTRANVTHGSDSVQAAQREIAIFFPELAR
ncbi:MAG: nucleoside-diphosphate kinase [Candidatus Nanopelagicales bacterium]